MFDEKDCIVKTKKYSVYSHHEPLVQGHIVFVPKEPTWRNLKDCFEAAYKWGYDWIDREYCTNFHVLQNAGDYYTDQQYVSLIPRQGKSQLDLDKIKDLFKID